MESKLLVGGKNIVDHTNEQQRMLELKRQEIAEQVQQTPGSRWKAERCGCFLSTRLCPEMSRT